MQVDWRVEYEGGLLTGPDFTISPWDCTRQTVLDVSEAFCPVEVLAPVNGRVKFVDLPDRHAMVNGETVFLPSGIEIDWLAEALGTEGALQTIDLTSGCVVSQLDATGDFCQLPVVIPTGAQIEISNEAPPIILNRGDNLTILSDVDTDINWKASANGYQSSSEKTFTASGCGSPMDLTSYFCDVTVNSTGTSSVDIMNNPDPVPHLANLLLLRNEDIWWSAKAGNERFSRTITCSGTSNAENVPTGTAVFTTYDVMFVVWYAGYLPPTSNDAKKLSLFESFSFSVGLLSHFVSQLEYDVMASASRAVYISSEVTSGTVGSVLVENPNGIVLEEHFLLDEFHISDDIAFVTNPKKLIGINQYHYITRDLAESEDIYDGEDPFDYEVVAMGGLPDGAVNLGRAQGSSGDKGGLVAIEAGAVLRDSANGDSNTAAGRRVVVPWGGDSFDFGQLSSSGELIVLRSLEWCMGQDEELGTRK